jgi:hypothetical protein
LLLEFAISRGCKVAAFLSDIESAFDRVDKDIILAKLQRTGLSSHVIAFFRSFLADRTAVVLCEGSKSEPFTLSDMLFQGTSSGPKLWNLFFEDFFFCTAFGTSTPDEVLQEKGLRVPNIFKGAAIVVVNRFCIYYVLSWLINNLAKVGYSVDIGGRQPLLEQFESC